MRHPALSLLALGALACSGKISETLDPGASGAEAATGGTSGTSGKNGSGGGSKGGSSGASGGSGGTSGGSAGDTTAVDGVAPVTRVARLTHTQYQNTINDLFGIEDDSAAAFAPDALNGFAFDTSVDFHVDERLGPQYRTAAEALAQKAVSDDSVFKRLVTCDTSASTCPNDFITSFGARAFRRPLTSTEATRFATLFAQGPDLVGSGDDFKDGVSLVVEAMLQSPQFLYRTELGSQTNAEGLITLDSFEMASRLSYFLWNTLPDAALTASATAGTLVTADQIASAVTRLVADARATNVAVTFHDEAWAFSRFSRIAPDAKTYPNAPTDMVTRVTDAAHAFVGDVVENDGSLRDLLTAPYAFADSALAPLYGQKVSGSALKRIDFGATERQGILMQLGFLASNAYAQKTDPIHRGLFVVRNLLCVDIPDPPAGAAQTPPPATDTPPTTTRGEVELLTGQPNCRGCHSQINPPGFAFEGFDAVGQIRADENGATLDTTGMMTIDNTTVSFKTPIDVVQAVAKSADARRCYASKWLEFAYGRNFADTDAASQLRLSDTEQSVRDVMAAVTQTQAFRYRAPNEVAK